MGNKVQDSTTLNQSTWNSSTTAGASGATVSAYSIGYAVALITTQNTGTVSAGTITWEGWDGFNWYVLPTLIGTAANTTTATTYTLTTGSAYFFANVNAFSKVRTRLTVAITGSGTVLVNINLSAATDHAL